MQNVYVFYNISSKTKGSSFTAAVSPAASTTNAAHPISAPQATQALRAIYSRVIDLAITYAQGINPQFAKIYQDGVVKIQDILAATSDPVERYHRAIAVIMQRDLYKRGEAVMLVAGAEIGSPELIAMAPSWGFTEISPETLARATKAVRAIYSHVIDQAIAHELDSPDTAALYQQPARQIEAIFRTTQDPLARYVEVVVSMLLDASTFAGKRALLLAGAEIGELALVQKVGIWPLLSRSAEEALITACRNGHPSIVTHILSETNPCPNIDPVTHKKYGKTTISEDKCYDALEAAFQSGNVQCFERVLSSSGHFAWVSLEYWRIKDRVERLMAKAQAEGKQAFYDIWLNHRAAHL